MTRRTANEQLLKDDYLMINPEDAQANLINEGDYVC
jgi:formate dehydrogenase major subunit